MVKNISIGLARRDDPMFTGRVEIFSVRKPKKSSPSGTIGSPLDILASFDEDDTDGLTDPENDGGVS
jgi:hypothetical protein